MLKPIIRRLLVGAAALVASALIAGPALAQKTKITVYTALENDQLGPYKQAFEAARRAIIRCGSSGFDLPAEKYGHWRDIEMTFNPERMRIR